MRYHLTLTAPAATLEAADTEARRLTGIAVPYGEVGYTSAGPLTIDAGAIRVPGNLKAVKLFREHGRNVPVGYATEATDTPDALHMAFTVARTPDGDQALLEATEGLRDALSVELNNVDVEAGHVTGADLVAVAQVAVPAYASATLTAALDDQAQADVNDLAQQIVDATAATDDTTPAADDNNPDTATTEQESRMDTTAAAPPATLQAAAPMLPAGSAGRPATSFAALCGALRTAAEQGRSLTAALTDIIPANDVGLGALRPQWLDEVWTPVAARRYFIEAINHQVLTSGLKVYGWQWNVFPTVSTYAGAKAAVPSSAASTKAIEVAVERLAGGWDLDRIFVDLGEPGFIEAFFQAAVRDLSLKQDADVGATLAAAVTALDGTAVTDVWVAITTAATALAGRGASMTFCGLSADLWAKYVTQATATVPWWVPNGPNPSLNQQTGDAADVPFFMAPSLPAKTLLAGDRNAATFYEPSPNPIRVNAVNLPNGGIDLGVFGYHAILVNDVRGLSKVTTA